MTSPVIIYPEGEVTYEYDAQSITTDKPIAAHSLTAEDPKHLGWDFTELTVTGEGPVVVFELDGFYGSIDLSDIRAILEARLLSEHANPFTLEAFDDALHEPDDFLNV